eukprot:5380847-Lingulodinium_polyedra.AAC.1
MDADRQLQLFMNTNIERLQEAPKDDVLVAELQAQTGSWSANDRNALLQTRNCKGIRMSTNTFEQTWAKR